MLGTIPGQHWRISVTTSDPKLTPDTAKQLGNLVTAKLNMVVDNVDPETKGWPVSFADLRKDSEPVSPFHGHGLMVVISVDRRDSTIVISTRYFGKPQEEEKIERSAANEVLAIIKQQFPASHASPFVAYRGIMGP